MYAPSGPNAIRPIPCIFCFGDSGFAYGNDVGVRGWMAQLADAVRMRADVINRGSAGFNTRMGLDYFPRPEACEMVTRAVAGGRCHLLVLCLGANDAAFPERDPVQYVPLEEYSRNMGLLLDMIKGWGVPEDRTLVVAPPPVRPGQKEKRMDERTARYAEACREVCAGRKVRFADMRALISGGEDLWIQDGLHLNGAGNDLLYRAVAGAAGDLLSKEKLPYSHVHWSVYQAPAPN